MYFIIIDLDEIFALRLSFFDVVCCVTVINCIFIRNERVFLYIKHYSEQKLHFCATKILQKNCASNVQVNI